jgi:hypothetical protein
MGEQKFLPRDKMRPNVSAYPAMIFSTYSVNNYADAGFNQTSVAIWLKGASKAAQFMAS